MLWRDTYREGNGNLNVWIYGKPAKGVGWGWWRCWTLDDLQQQITRQQQDGKRVAILSIFEAEGRCEYHIEWLLDGIEVQYDLDFSLPDLEAKIDERRGQWWLSFVDAYGRGTGRKYSAVWAKATEDHALGGEPGAAGLRVPA